MGLPDDGERTGVQVIQMQNAECRMPMTNAKRKRKQRSHRNGGTPAADFDVERNQAAAFRIRIEF